MKKTQKYYYALADTKVLYYLTQAKQNKYLLLFPDFRKDQDEAYLWIEQNGTVVGTVETFAY